MGIRQYSLKELSERTGIEPRTIRWYISEGLLRGPESLGPNARYTDHHLRRLETIRLLKDTYALPLAEIRRYVMMAGDEDIQVVPVLSSQYGKPTFGYSESGDEVSKKRDHPKKPPGRFGDSRTRTSPPPPSFMSRGPVRQLVDALRGLLGDRRVPRTSRAITISEIEVTPELTLRLRGDFAQDDIALFEQIGDHLRELILGGPSHHYRSPIHHEPFRPDPAPPVTPGDAETVSATQPVITAPEPKPVKPPVPVETEEQIAACRAARLERLTSHGESMASFMKLDPLVQLERIANDPDHPVDYYPQACAEISTDILSRLPCDVLGKLRTKLADRRIGPWKKLAVRLVELDNKPPESSGIESERKS